MGAPQTPLLLGEPDSPEQRVETSYHAALLTICTAAMAVVALLIVAVTDASLPGFRPGHIALLAAAALLLGVFARLYPNMLTPARMPVYLFLATGAIGSGVYFVGPEFGGLV